MVKLHVDELDLDANLVRTLVAGQFPELADRPVRPLRSTGTVNAIYRLGDDLYVRLPLVAGSERALEREQQWLPRLGPQVSLRIPEPVGSGRPAAGYPLPWAVFRWIEGAPYDDPLVADERLTAIDLARFVQELRPIDPTGAPPAGRRPLAELDRGTRETIAAGRVVIDADAALRAWERALLAPVWAGPPVWIHTDLLRPNLLVHDGRLQAVIDFGGAGIGDPAADVIPAWSVFGPVGRAAYRDALAVDDGTWQRARGYALHQAAAIIPYYRDTNPVFVDLAVRTVEQVLADI